MCVCSGSLCSILWYVVLKPSGSLLVGLYWIPRYYKCYACSVYTTHNLHQLPQGPGFIFQLFSPSTPPSLLAIFQAPCPLFPARSKLLPVSRLLFACACFPYVPRVLQLQYLRLKAGSSVAFAKRVEFDGGGMDWGGGVCREDSSELTTTSILSNYRIGSGLLASLGLIRSVVRPGIQRKWWIVGVAWIVGPTRFSYEQLLDGDSDLTQNRISWGWAWLRISRIELRISKDQSPSMALFARKACK